MSRPEIVAELSCNHLGSLHRAQDLIELAAVHGADSVKVQCWHPDRMVMAKSYTLEDGPWKGRTLGSLYDEAHTPWHWIPSLMSMAAAHKVGFFASVFDDQALKYLEELGCPRYKIASFEIVDLDLIRKVAATGKPMVISTGMATAREVNEALEAAHHCRDMTLLHCVSAYPAEPSAMRLQRLDDFRRIGAIHGWNLKVGLSDHTLGNTAAIAAVALGAKMIEKHFIQSRGNGGPDAAFSIEPRELGELRHAVDEAYQAVLMTNTDGANGEEPQRALRRSLYWARNISAGEFIAPERDMVTARPALGDNPIHREHYAGHTLARTVYRGEPVQWSDVAPMGSSL